MKSSEFIGFLVMVATMLILSISKKKPSSPDLDKENQKQKLKRFLSSLQEKEEPPPKSLPPSRQKQALLKPSKPLFVETNKVYETTYSRKKTLAEELVKGVDWRRQILIKEILDKPKGL